MNNNSVDDVGNKCKMTHCWVSSFAMIQFINCVYKKASTSSQQGNDLSFSI